jgi:hypothetical protein
MNTTIVDEISNILEDETLTVEERARLTKWVDKELLSLKSRLAMFKVGADDPEESSSRMLKKMRQPKKVISSSRLSPNKRRLYLSHKSRSGSKVLSIANDLVAVLTSDEEFPIDQCCVNPLDKLMTCYSSAHIRAAKKEDAGASINILIELACRMLVSQGQQVPSDARRKFPKDLATRQIKIYAKIPIDDSGKLLLSSPDYPVLSEAPKYWLSAYTWGTIAQILRFNQLFTSTLFWCPGEDSVSRPYFAIRDAYHVLIQELEAPNVHSSD